jgi:hypothetical protein
MGASVAALALRSWVVVVGHAGDAQCFRLRRGVLRQLTARDERWSGGGPLGAPGFAAEPPRDYDCAAGDTFLLCNHQVAGGVGDVLSANAPDEAVPRLVLRLVDAARRRAPGATAPSSPACPTSSSSPSTSGRGF